jgi:hypothetical protein
MRPREVMLPLYAPMDLVLIFPLHGELEIVPFDRTVAVSLHGDYPIFRRQE